MPKILAIDGKPDKLAAISSLLKQWIPESAVITAQSGEEGIAKASVELPDAILLDAGIPGMDGFQICRRLKADTRTGLIPVIMVMPLRTDAQSRSQGLEIGADIVLSKPIDEHELVSQIKVALRIRAAEAALRRERDSLEAMAQARMGDLWKDQTNHRTLFNEMLDGFALHEIVCDADGVPVDYRFLAVNLAFERMTGLTAAAVVGRTVLEVLPRTERRWIETYGKVALAGETVSFEDYSAALAKHFEVRAFRTAPSQFGCVFQDITARKQAEEELRGSERRLKEAQRIAKIGSWEFDLTENRLFWSDEVFRIFEIDKKTFGLTNEAFIAAIHPEDRDAVRAAYQRSLDTKRPYAIVHRLQFPDGRIKHVSERCETTFDADGKAIYSAGTVQDVTEQIQRSQRLKASENKFRSYVENAPDGIFVADESGTYLEVNAAAERITGYSKEELVGRSIFETILPEDHPIAKQHFHAVVTSGAAVGELRYVHKSGEARYWSVKAAKLNDRCSIGFVSDITDRKRAEMEREQLQAQLLQAQKMESVGRLAGGVAHDFNNMLGVILGYTELAFEGVDPSLPLHHHLREIRKAAQRSADLTRQLLAFARKQIIAPKVLDLNATIAGMTKMLQRLIGENIDLVWQPSRGLWQVKVDPSQIDQILANLCVNARDAITGVGQVTIETKNEVFDEAYRAAHPDFAVGEYVLLAVRDNGCGMDKKTLDSIFEPFFTTKNVGQGTGLGLATIYGAVRQNQGVIQVESEPGQGTTIKIYFPRHKGENAPFLRQAPAEPAVRPSKTILLVEDEPALLRMIMQMLERMGYTVLAARNPGEAIRLAEAHAGAIHLLMTDVIMPEMNGRDLAEHLLSLYPDLKRLFMSGYTADVVAHHGVVDEGVQFIQKPFSITDLAAKLRQALWLGPAKERETRTPPSVGRATILEAS